MLDKFQHLKKQKKKRFNLKNIKADSLPRKQNKNVSQNNKKFIKNVVPSGFGYLK